MKALVRKSIIKRSLVSSLVRKTLLATGNKFWQYNRDGIDDYSRFLAPIPAFENDLIEFDIEFTGIAPNTYILDGRVSGLNSEGVLQFNASSALSFSGFTALKVDGVPYTTGMFTPATGVTHHIEVTAADLTYLWFIGVRYSVSGFISAVIKNLGITRAVRDNLDQYPDLFFPMDDGWANNPMMRQTIPHHHKTDGTESYDMDGAVWLDYETEAAPQYVRVTGYETLAERAVLSGLSENEEAKASCREGLVKNGDFRFGDNGSWSTAVGSGWTFSTEGATSVNSTVNCTQLLVLDDSQEYILDFEIKDTTLGSLRVEVGSGNFIGSGLVDGNYSVKFTSIAGADPIYFYATSGAPFSGVVTNISVRKVTDQQVLTPYVNHGEYVNFNEEGWEYV
ncbi:hypothetical protein CTH30272_02110 [Allocatenococcus thiocycli]|nr:hypothetical protein CTH30272_02110 [Catenococcus thiocycli]